MSYETNYDRAQKILATGVAPLDAATHAILAVADELREIKDKMEGSTKMVYNIDAKPVPGWTPPYEGSR